MLSLQRSPRGRAEPARFSQSSKGRPIEFALDSRIGPRRSGSNAASEIVVPDADREELESVFLNLFENSVLATSGAPADSLPGEPCRGL